MSKQIPNEHRLQHGGAERRRQNRRDRQRTRREISRQQDVSNLPHRHGAKGSRY